MARILIVDDEPAVRTVYARALELDGHTTHEAASAEEGLELVRSTPPDAILLDLKMPFISGIGFLYRLREAEPTMPVAMITGMTDLDEATHEEIRVLGAELRHKPLPMAELQVIVRQLLSGRGVAALVLALALATTCGV